MNKDGGSMYGKACAACKHQRKKCVMNCQLAPYFPADRAEDFNNVYKVFGVNNVVKFLSLAPDHLRHDTAEALMLEAKFRVDNPVHGSLALQAALRTQIEATEEELGYVKKQISLCKEIARLRHQNVVKLETLPPEDEPGTSIDVVENIIDQSLATLPTLNQRLGDDSILLDQFDFDLQRQQNVG